MRRTLPLAALVLALPIAACGSGSETTPPSTGGHDAGSPPVACTKGPGPTPVNGFSRYTVDAASNGPAFAATGDVNGDGRTDLVVSTFGAVDTSGGAIHLDRGEVTAYLQGDGLDCWQKVPIVTQEDGFYFPNQIRLADVDGDGDLDLVLGAGFFVCVFDPTAGNCGALAWFENAAGKWVRHDVVPFGDDHFYHEGVFVDLDGDGTRDLVTVAEAVGGDVKTLWFKGDTSPDRFAKTPQLIGAGGGSLPVVADLDGDGDLDVASAEYFVNGESFVWFEHQGAAWTRHVLDDTSGKSIMLDAVPDLYGDGELRIVGTNHVNTQKTPPDPVDSAVFVFSRPADPTMKWPKEQISAGIVSRPNMGMSVQGAPGVFGHGDVDGDGDVDLVVSGDGDVHTYWLEQTMPGSFDTHVLEDSLGQAGGALVVDLDGDGKNEVVFTGYEDGKVYVYRFGK